MANLHIRIQTGRNSGFTLLELLAVMAIMVMLSTLAVTSYFAAIRGMARRGMYEQFMNTLMQARQRATVDGARVSLIIFNLPAGYDNDGNLDRIQPSYVVCRELGRVTFVTGNYLFDEFADLKQLFDVRNDSSSEEYGQSYQGGIRLYNLNRGCWSTVASRVVLPKEYGNEQRLLSKTTNKSKWDRHKFEDNAFQFLTAGASSRSANYTAWQTGDAYGIEVTPILNLPKTFYVDGLGWNGQGKPTTSALKEVQHVTFGPDGRSLNENGNPVQRSFTFRSTDEQIGSIRITVNNDGSFSIGGE